MLRPSFLAVALFLALSFGCSRAVQERSATVSNRALVERYISEVWNKGNIDAVDQLIASEFLDHDPANPPNLPPGAAGLKQHVAAMRAAFPDVHFTVEDMVVAGDKVVTRWTVRGTHKGALMGIPPTNKQVAVTGIWIDRIANGRIVEEWANWDTIGLLRQLGAPPRP